MNERLPKFPVISKLEYQTLTWECLSGSTSFLGLGDDGSLVTTGCGESGITGRGKTDYQFWNVYFYKFFFSQRLKWTEIKVLSSQAVCQSN